MNRIVAISGTCPEAGRPLTIKATVEEIRMAEALAPGYKVTRYYCEYADEHGCETRGEDRLSCPLYQKAKAAHR